MSAEPKKGSAARLRSDMKIAITGLPGSGKSTVFNAITHAAAAAGGGGVDTTKLHLGTVKVPDARLAELGRYFESEKITHIELTFLDSPGFNLSTLAGDIDALVGVVGSFYARHPVKDIEDLESEFILRDIKILENRLPQMEKEIRSGKTDEKKEFETLLKCKAALSENMPLRNMAFSEEELRLMRTYQFLSQKPLLLINNIAETSIGENTDKDLADYVGKKNLLMIEFCGKTELDILDLPESEREGFLKEMGIDVMARDKFIKAAFDLLNLVTFYTVKGREARAWAVSGNTPVLEAAGKIHTDMKRGFIKAEVISYNDIVSCGGKFAEARGRGLLRLEGREYVVGDGDILDIRFNV